MIRGEIAELTNNLVNPSQQMENTDLIGDDIGMSSDLLKHCSVCLHQEALAWLEASSCSALVYERDIPTVYHEPSSSNTDSRPSWAICHTDHSRPFPFRANPPQLLHFPLSAWIAFRQFLPMYIILWLYFITQARLLRGCMVRIRPVFRFRRRSLPRFWELLWTICLVRSAFVSRFRRRSVPRFWELLWIIVPTVWLTLEKWYCYRKLDEFMKLRKELRGVFSY